MRKTGPNQKRRRRYPGAERSETRALTRKSGTPRRWQARINVGQISDSVRISARGRIASSARRTQSGKSSGLYTSTSAGPTCFSASRHPVELVVLKTKRRPGSRARMARIICPAT